jgi:hypothetical protein
MKKNNKVWEILLEDEKSALLLSISYGKSTWQAGEIMNKAHYKYLEILARANKFFKMFTEYFESTGGLRIPKDCHFNHFFRDYIIMTVFERIPEKEAIKNLGLNPFIVKTAKERIFKECLDLLANHENETYQDLFHLIMEFDRWNNSRILPTSLQEPSAFKRRNKARLVKHLKNLSNLDYYHVKRFEKSFKAKPGKKKLYIAVLSKNFEAGYKVIRIGSNKDIISYISKDLRLYIFNEEVDADNFGYIVHRYLHHGTRDCKKGQEFWPLYRKSIEVAANYLDVNNIIPQRKHLEKAFRDMDEIIIRRKGKIARDISDPQTRVRKEELWSI